MMTIALLSENKAFLSSTAPIPYDDKVIKSTSNIVPKGMTKFEFNDGFVCYALNMKNAIKKHNNFIKHF